MGMTKGFAEVMGQCCRFQRNLSFLSALFEIVKFILNYANSRNFSTFRSLLDFAIIFINFPVIFLQENKKLFFFHFCSEAESTSLPLFLIVILCHPLCWILKACPQQPTAIKPRKTCAKRFAGSLIEFVCFFLGKHYVTLSQQQQQKKILPKILYNEVFEKGDFSTHRQPC